MTLLLIIIIVLLLYITFKLIDIHMHLMEIMYHSDVEVHTGEEPYDQDLN